MRFTIKDVNRDDKGLCSKCEFLEYVKFEDGSSMVKCSWFSKILRKRVESCSEFAVKGRASLREMKDAAWLIDVDPRRKVGFKWVKPRGEGREEMLERIQHIKEEETF